MKRNRLSQVAVHGGGAAAPVMLANGARIVMLGDSIPQQNHVGYAVGNPLAGKSSLAADCGEMQWAYAVDPRFNFDVWADINDARGTTGFLRYISGANQGIGGENSAQVLARVSETITLDPDAVVLNVGTNDNNPTYNLTTADSQTNILAIVDALQAAGIRVILGTPRPEIASGYDTDAAALWTWAQATFGPGTSYPNVVLWGAYPLLLASGATANDFRDSTLHPGVRGAQATALGTDLSVPTNSLLGCIRQIVSSGNIITTDLRARTSFGKNPTLTGATGTLSTFTGQAPDLWNITRSTGTGFTGTAAVAANADTGGQSAVLTITPGGTANNEEWRLQLATALVTTAAQACQSKWMCLIAEVEHDGNPIFGPIRAEVSTNDANYQGGVFRTGTSTSNLESRRQRGALRYFLRSAPMLMPATLTSVQTAIYGNIQNNGNVAAGVCKVHWARLVEYGDPRTAWGL